MDTPSKILTLHAALRSPRGSLTLVTTGPTGPLARAIREHAECSPCLLRECPIDHRCMTHGHS
jgi:hypothetical protein